MRSRVCLALLLLTSAAFAQHEGDFVSRAQLVHELAVDKSHPLARKVIAVDEGTISSKPSPQPILVVHYRAEPEVQFSLNDDRVVVALRQGDGFRILRVLESETTLVDDALYSINDFEEEFISIRGLQFLYIRTKVSGSGNGVMDDVYSIWSDGKLTSIPFDDVNKSSYSKQAKNCAMGIICLESGIFTIRGGDLQIRRR